MGEIHELQLHIREPVPLSQNDATSGQPLASSKLKNWRWWLMLLIYTLFILVGQIAGTLLGRFYYNQGGKSLWMATIVLSAGFPLIIPVILLQHLPPSSAAKPRPSSAAAPRPSAVKVGATYAGIGLLVSGNNLMYSYGLLYLPVSTYSLLCATQLAFNAVFSYFLNSQKFTPFVFNSIILLTLAASLLGVHSGDDSVPGENYPLGLTITIAASAVFSLTLSLTQLAFQKVLKTERFAVVLEMILWTGLVTTSASVVGLFAAGDWRRIHEEFVGFEKGRVSYVMTMLSIAVSWLVYSVGNVGLIFFASSLFANVIGTLGLPLVPIFAVLFFHDSMDGVKVVAMLIAILGFSNYVYQHYLDDSKEKGAEMKEENL